MDILDVQLSKNYTKKTLEQLGAFGRNGNTIEFLNYYYSENDLLNYIVQNEGTKLNGIFYNTNINGYCSFEAMYKEWNEVHFGYVEIRGIHGSNYSVDYRIDDEDASTWYKHSSVYDDSNILNEISDINGVLNVVSEQASNAFELASQAQTIARNANVNYVFDTVEELDNSLLDENFTSNLIAGDNFYIKQSSATDYWWDGSQKRPIKSQS